MKTQLTTALVWLALCFSASGQSVQQSGNVTPGHAACWAITGVVYDCGSPGGGVSVVGSTTQNDFAAFNGSGSLIDSGINPAVTSNWSGLQNFNGGATAPTRPLNDNTTYLATTAFVQNYSANLLASTNTWTALNTFTAGLESVPTAPGTVISDPGLYNCFFGSTIYCGNTTFINTVAPGYLDTGVSGLTIAAPNGFVAGIFAAQCSTNTGVGYLSCGAPLQAYTYADTVPCPVSGCANQAGVFVQYNQMNLLAGSDPVALGGGRTYGAEIMEMSVSSLWGYVSGTDPYNYNPTGAVVGLRIDCGTGSGSTNNCGGFAFEAVPNNKAFTGGYLCGHGAIVSQTIFGYTVGPCMSMDDGHGLFWYSATGTLAAGIFEQISMTPYLHLALPTNGTLEFDVNGAAAMAWNATTFYSPNNNVVAIGTSGLRFSGLFSVDGNFSGTLTLPNSATWTSSGLSSLTLVGPLAATAQSTIASAAGATLDDVDVAPETTTITGTTNITTSTGFNKVSIYTPTYTDSSAVTITNAATLFIQSAPAAAGHGHNHQPVGLVDPRRQGADGRTGQHDRLVDLGHRRHCELGMLERHRREPVDRHQRHDLRHLGNDVQDAAFRLAPGQSRSGAGRHQVVAPGRMAVSARVQSRVRIPRRPDRRRCDRHEPTMRR